MKFSGSARRVELKNNQGRKIVGLIDLPKNQGRSPVVVICHGFTGYKEEIHLKSLAQTLAKNGIAAMRFDFTNERGESDGTIEDINFSQELADLKSVIDFISYQGFIDPARIGLAGHSMGGQVALTYGPTDPRIKVLADLAGVAYRGAQDTELEKKLRGRADHFQKNGFLFIWGYKIKFDFYTDLLKHDTLSQVKKISIPTIIVHGRTDRIVPLKHSQTVYEILREPKRLVVIDGMPHTWRQPIHYKKVNPLVAEWFKKYL
ncbi:MAG: hypothetical protein A2744_04310 [Candidatus Buchananbacteria bacterium RIFCSPHIGHO2_01_FULL_44_11]|uniref:Serine aminopeptidase S33 domain-containing protein n=1 Tax=Candidatus Buchananbacteria bacterium RIFCSPHIGHO2_01_FULL_44_11 TaxID=1797535 RepID=A0A1G1XZ95_9BACT|nr:MAG: hypothetical protein A2744_04310 [Candidatus Buchananbacteria bacterium RIFCSPHIGHO2_01_FULL_44_11]